MGKKLKHLIKSNELTGERLNKLRAEHCEKQIMENNNYFIYTQKNFYRYDIKES